MSDKDINVINKLDELLSANPDISPSERLIHLQDLGNCLPKSYVCGLEQKLYNVLKVYLHSKNFELRKCALNLLHNCLQNDNLKTLSDALSLNLAYAVIYFCNSGKDDLAEYQEVWLKAFDTLQLMCDLYPILNKNHGIRLLSVFQKALSVPYTSSVQKLKALHLLDKYVASVDIQNVKELLYHICSEQLLPLAFSKSNFCSICLQIAYRLLPGIKQVLIKYPEEWEKIFADIRSKYVPAIERLIADNDCTFANLWVFLIKLIGSKFHKGSPVVNSLLSCIEAAFKVPNLEVRKQSFLCWQVLIEGFTIETNEASVEKRIKLLTIPLKTNNGKTEELVKVKIIAWNKLLEVLNKNNLIGSFGVLDAYLGFCFGPFCYKDTPGLVSQGKKYSSVHLTTCKSLLQLIGNPKYIEKDLEPKLNVINIKIPAIKATEFGNFSENIIDSVGESCLMLSQLENSNRLETTAVNEALWKSLFSLVDVLDNSEVKTKAIHEISKIILVLINVARKKTNLINFGLIPLFNIITSNEFNFCQERQFAKELFIPMFGVMLKKDKILFHNNVIVILKNVFIFKRSSEHFLEFIDDANTLFVKENITNAEKVILLRSIWYIIEEELFNINLEKNADEKLLNMFCDFLNWPIATLKCVKSGEKIDLKWRELYSLFCNSTSGLLQNKLSCMLMHKICESVKNIPNSNTIAEYAYYIISNLKLENCDEESCEQISQIYSDIKTIISTPLLSPEIVNIYESCVSHMLDTTFKFPKIHCLLPSINSCLTSLLDIYSKMDILRPAQLFLDQLDKNDDKLKPEIDNLTQILDKYKKNTPDNKLSSNEVDTNIVQSEQTTMILLGHDINTMTPVKLKGSMLVNTREKQSPIMDKLPKNKIDEKDTNNSEVVYVNSPYRFDPKKLTKQQKERLSRRRDDVPSLYQDLTQSSSQLDEFNTSNSESLLVQIKPKLDEVETKENENKTENNKESNESSHSEDIIQSDSEPIEKNTRVKRQRKSLTLTKETSEPTEKKKRGRKPKFSIDNVNTSPNGTSKENMDLNKIQPETVGILKVTRRRRSTNLPNKSYMGNIADVVEDVDDVESSSSDTISEQVANNLPIKLRITNKNKRKSKIISPPENNEMKKLKQNENADTTKTDDNDKLNIEESTIDDAVSEKNSLINLEENIELNKLENVPIHLKRPARIFRGNRRLSEGNVVKKQPTEKNIIDYANLIVTKQEVKDEKVKKKIIRELKNIKIDIKNSNEYLKTNGRKTRLSQQTEKDVQRTRRGKLTNKLKTDEVQSEQKQPEHESEESDFIESSQENEKQMNIKECEVRALYSLDKINSTTLLQESESNNRPKISPIKINIKSNKLVKCDSPKTKENEVTESPNIIQETEASQDNEPPANNETEQLPLIIDKLDTQDVTVATETESISSQRTESEGPTEDICETRKVILSTSVISTEDDDTPSTPPKLLNKNNLPTSPVSNDTPTRNKELIEDTLEISPIKKVPTNKINPDEVATTIALEPEKPLEENESPELFESETPSLADQKADDTEKLSGNSSQYTNRVLRKNKSRVLTGRSAKMMKMISAKQTFVPATSAKTATTTTATVHKNDNYCSPSSNRTKKMMNNLEKCDVIQDTEATASATAVVTTPSTSSNQTSTTLITQDDVLFFEKQLPSPFALPGGSILKRKRNGAEETTEETIAPVIKKRRVNFSDPPVSCLKFIEKTIKPAICYSKHLPKELRSTRASTAEEQEIDSEINAEQQHQESQSLLDIVPLEEEEIETPETTIITCTKTYDNIKPICETLIDNEEPIAKILAKLTNSLDFIDPVATVLENKNIDTIGDLAKLTESQVYIIPLKVETVKAVLKEYCESLKQDSPTREKRKITPLVLSTPEKKPEHSTCEVSVIIENKDVTSETQSVAMVEELKTQQNEYSEKLFSTDSEKSEVSTTNKAILVASSQDNLFSSPINRTTIKTEFDSPTNAKDNILNEEYCKIRVVKFLQFIRNLINKNKFDPKPIINVLFANNTEILKQMNCWEDIVKYIVRDIGIWTLTKYLCGLKNIPALMIESILKNSLNEIGNDFICERLNKHEIIKFLSKEYNLISLLQEYEPQTVYTTFFDLANDSQYTHLKYKEMLQELYATVFQPQIEIIQILYKLDVDNIGFAVVKRMSDPKEMDTFLENIYKSVPLEVYLKPINEQTKKTLPITNKETSKDKDTIENKDEVVANAVNLIDNNQLSKDEELLILRSIAKKWSALEFFQTFSQHTKQN